MGIDSSKSASAKPLLVMVASLLLGMALSSCGQVPLEDVTNASEFKAVVGSRFRVSVNAQLIGVTADQNYKKQVDFYVLVSAPGFSGPEVVSKELVPAGAVVKVVGVLRSNIPLIDRIVYLVEIADGPRRSAPIRVTVVGVANDSNAGLDQSLFVKI